MIRLIAQYKVFKSLDSKAPLSRWWRRILSHSAELSQFDAAATALDHKLRALADEQEFVPRPPPDLHDAIMRAVKEAAVRPIAGPQGALSPMRIGSPDNQRLNANGDCQPETANAQRSTFNFSTSRFMARWRPALAASTLALALLMMGVAVHFTKQPPTPASADPVAVDAAQGSESQLAATWGLVDQINSHNLALWTPPLAQQFEALAQDLEGAINHLLASMPR